MGDKTDILLLGATGFTGRLITRYLSVHPQRNAFTFAVAARSDSKLQNLLEELNLHKDSSIRRVQVDVTDEASLERAIKTTRVVINTVGPYWRWGTPVVKACVLNGVHYVDLTGEAVWTKQIIRKFDFLATKTGAIIVPSCGYDSIPSDITAYLSNKTLKSLPIPLEMGSSTTAHKLKGGISGGTLSTVVTMLEQVPKEELKESSKEYSLSPIEGHKPPRGSLYYSLPMPGARPLIGSFFFMQPANKAVVQRTFGLLEYAIRTNPKSKQAQAARYGPDFVYDEFLVMPNVFSAVTFTLMFMTGFLMVVFVPPIRWLFKKVIPQPGDGPSDEDMKNGYLVCTNLTKSASQPPVHVKTVLKCKGDPGYLLTAIMISESALSLLLPTPSSKKSSHQDALQALPELAQRGGVLTPMTAFGDVLIQRLEATKRFEFSSSVVTDDRKAD